MVDKGIVMLVLLRAADGLQIRSDTPAIPLWRLARRVTRPGGAVCSARATRNDRRSILGPNAGTGFGLVFQATAQKAIVIVADIVIVFMNDAR